MRILLEVFTPGRAAEVQALAEFEKAGLFTTEGRITERSVERTILDRDLPGGEDSLLAADGRLLERFGTRKQVLALIGAGHVGRAVIIALAPLDFSVVWIDPRKDEFPSIVPGDVRVVVASEPAAELDAVDGALVMSHSHALDFDVVLAALRGKAVRLRRPDRLGVEEGSLHQPHAAGRAWRSDIERLVCPIGIDGVTSSSGGHCRVGGRALMRRSLVAAHGARSLVIVARVRSYAGCTHHVMAGRRCPV